MYIPVERRERTLLESPREEASIKESWKFNMRYSTVTIPEGTKSLKGKGWTGGRARSSIIGAEVRKRKGGWRGIPHKTLLDC